jgi:hypothetical protein
MLRVRAFRQPHRCDGIGLFIEDICRDKMMVIDGLLRFRELKSEEFYQPSPQPDVSLDMKAGQKLMDDLWDAGLRPSEGTGSAGSFAAQGRHLEDMRKLVFETPELLCGDMLGKKCPFNYKKSKENEDE